MDRSEDVIVAVATPPGRGGLAVVRLSGPGAPGIARRLVAVPGSLEARRATVGVLEVAGDEDGRAIGDEAVVTLFAAPASYTGEDVVEIAVHGSPLVAAAVVNAAVRLGARVAGRGEFTLRAFVNGRIDLAQAEAVQDLVAATTPLQARVAFDQLRGTLSERIGVIDREVFELAAALEASLDFPDEGYHFIDRGGLADALDRVAAEVDELLAEGTRGRLVREGATAAIVGRTNVGKSTVFNRLAGGERAIVTAVPGTTRDLLIETVALGGVPVTLVDTAGMRAAADPIEREGVRRAERARQAAALVVVVLDGSAALEAEDERLLTETAGQARVIAVNKCDVPSAWSAEERLGEASAQAIQVSGLDGTGIGELGRAVARALGAAEEQEPPLVSNSRHVELLRRARRGLAGAREALESEGQMPEEVVLAELQSARDALEEVTGRRTPEDLLEEIFSRFCVGK